MHPRVPTTMGASCSIDGLPEEAIELAKSHAEGLKAKGVTTDEQLTPPMSAYIDALRIAHKPGATPLEIASAFSEALKADREAQALVVAADVLETNEAIASAKAALDASPTIEPPEGAAMAAENHQKEVDTHLGMVTNQAHHTFLLAVDGHESSSKTAFEACLRLMKNRDQVRLMHCFDPEQQEALPLNERAASVKEFYSVECVGRLPKARWMIQDDDWIKTPGLHDDDAATLLTDAVNRVRVASGSPFVSRARPSFLVVGTDRSKGAHQVPAVLQSRQDLALRRIVMPCVVVKKACAPKDNFLFVAAVKSPQSNLLCFEVATLLKKERDTMVILHVQDETTSPGDADNNKAAVEKEIHACGLNATFTAIQKKGGTTVAETMEAWCEENAVDWLLLAPAHGKTDMVSVTHHFVKSAKTNVVICKK